MKDEIQELCDNHWEYIEKVIRNEYDLGTATLTEPGFLDIDAYCRRVELHYKTAFRHGFKHGVQSERQRV